MTRYFTTVSSIFSCYCQFLETDYKSKPTSGTVSYSRTQIITNEQQCWLCLCRSYTVLTRACHFFGSWRPFVVWQSTSRTWASMSTGRAASSCTAAPPSTCSTRDWSTDVTSACRRRCRTRGPRVSSTWLQATCSSTAATRTCSVLMPVAAFVNVLLTDVY